MLLTRFAPTPSGYLHLGNAFSFIITWLTARLQDGKILLRIDDLDNERFRPEYLDDIFYSLEWLGLDYDLGPFGVADFHARWSQHRRIELYRQALNRLQPHLFACTCSRKTLQQTSPDGQYRGNCIGKDIPFETPQTALRLFTPPARTVLFRQAGKNKPLQALPYEYLRHPVLRRKDGLPAYQLASVTDDCLFGVNWVVRGADLFASTVAQVYIAECLQEPHFGQITFLHHPLLTDANGAKLSKSAGSRALKTLAEREKTPARIYTSLSALLLPEEPPARSAAELLQRTELENVLKIKNLSSLSN